MEDVPRDKEDAWDVFMERMLRCPDEEEDFVAFLRDTHCEENWSFLREVLQWCESYGSRAMQSDAQRIYDTYRDVVDLPSSVCRAIEHELAVYQPFPHLDMWDEAVQHTVLALNHDSLQKYRVRRSRSDSAVTFLPPTVQKVPVTRTRSEDTSLQEHKKKRKRWWTLFLPLLMG